MGAGLEWDCRGDVSWQSGAVKLAGFGRLGQGNNGVRYSTDSERRPT